jgi:hypothetical protein
MPFQPLKKKTLLMPSGPQADPDRKHLWVILTDACLMEAHLLVSICTLRADRFHDPACILNPGDHRRIKDPSWVEYRRSRTMHSYALVNGASAWLYHPDDPISDPVFERICEGLLTSEHTPIRFKRYFDNTGRAF